jgi:Raf kinase inhibitor-like YbhB/YbcL family protein
MNCKMKRGIMILFGIFSAAHCAGGIPAPGGGNMKITSPDFRNNEMIPKKFTCEGEDASPCLVMEGIPQGAKSLALVVDDPDAPMGTWVHWVVYDIPPLDRIEQGAIPGKQGKNDFGRRNYGGPCPPSGTHRYFFKCYALDKMLDLKEGLSKKELEHSLRGHILEKAELVGLYKRTR